MGNQVDKRVGAWIGFVPRLALGRALRAGLVLAVAFGQQSSARAVAPITEDHWSDALGRGFDSRLGSIAGPCIAGQIEYRGNRSGEIDAHYNDTFSDFLRTTSGRLSGGVDLLLIGGSMSVDYYAKVARTELSTSYTVRFVGKMGTAVLAQRSLTSLGAGAVNLDAATRRATCGDEFIAQADVGSELLISAGFHFTDASELERFVKKVTVKALFGLIKSSHEWTEETSSFSQSGYLKIDALQTGGSPSQLAAILGNSNTTLCRFDNVDACRAILVSLFQYAGSPSGFGAQFSNPYQPQQLAVLGYRTVRYEAGGHDQLAAPPAGPEDADIPQVISSLSLELARQTALRDRAMLVLGTQVSDARRAELRAIQSKAEANLTGLDHALWICRTVPAPAQCRAARDDEALHRQPISSSELQL